MPTALLKPEIQDFIARHKDADVRDLALKKMPPEWPRAAILNQIQSRQKSKGKISSWLAAHTYVIFPVPDLIEQASSDATARYKASLFQGERFVDLTGGVGVDCAAFAKNFNHVTCVENNSEAAILLRHNLPLVTGKEINCIATDARTALQSIELPVDLIYIDPQRRNKMRKGLKYFEECSPDIIDLLPVLLEKSSNILIKTSPMLDIQQALAQLPQTRTVYVVEWQKDCREVLYHLTREPNHAEVTIKAVSLKDDGTSLHEYTFIRTEEKEAIVQFDLPQTYLYEPGPAFMKAGCYKSLSDTYGVKKLHQHTHLYTSDIFVPNFPGKSFKILGTYPVRKDALPVSKTNLAVRNFSDDVQTLYKRLNLKPGGNDMVFACTCLEEQKILIHTQFLYNTDS